MNGEEGADFGVPGGVRLLGVLPLASEVSLRLEYMVRMMRPEVRRAEMPVRGSCDVGVADGDGSGVRERVTRIGAGVGNVGELAVGKVIVGSGGSDRSMASPSFWVERGDWAAG